MSYIVNTNLWRKKNKAQRILSDPLNSVSTRIPTNICHKNTVSDDLIVFPVTVSSNQSIIIHEKFS